MRWSIQIHTPFLLSAEKHARDHRRSRSAPVKAPSPPAADEIGFRRGGIDTRDMGSVSSEDASDDRCGSYSPSADVSASESSSDFSSSRRRPYSAVSAPIPLPPLPALADLFLWDDGDKLDKPPPPQLHLSEVEMMKERFAKLLLGEDMSGGGKGVCTALAISNAITNLSATVFGELWRLEPLAPQKKAMWHREMDWLLCVSDFILELIPSVQDFPGGGTYEVMASRPRSDLYMNLPALKKLDVMLLGMLDGFRETEFWYVDRGIPVAEEGDGGSGSYPSSSFGRPSSRQEEKWWLPCPCVPPNGLSEDGRKRLQQCRDCTNQILKAAMAINSAVLAEMVIPDAYLETLPKNGKSCLGEIIYRYVTADQFSPECLLDCLDLSSEYHTLDIVNRIEAAVHVWRLKDRKKHPLHLNANKSSWSGKVKEFISDAGRNHIFAERAEGLLQSLRLRYPGLSQTVLDMNKIQYNKDVGQAILESYSRVMESLAFNIMARIDDLIYVDDTTKRCATAEAVSLFNRGVGGLPIQKRILPSPFSVQKTLYTSSFSTPTYCSSTPTTGSPGRAQPSSLNKDTIQGKQEGNLGKLVACDTKGWSYTGNLSASKDAGDARERD